MVAAVSAVECSDVRVRGRGEDRDGPVVQPGAVVPRQARALILLDPVEGSVRVFLRGLQERFVSVVTREIVRPRVFGNAGHHQVREQFDRQDDAGGHERRAPAEHACAPAAGQHREHDDESDRSGEDQFRGLGDLREDHHHGEESRGADRAQHHDGGLLPAQLPHRLIAEHQNDRDIQERLPRGQAVRIVETVPDIVQDVHRERQQQEGQQRQVGELFADAGLRCGKIQREQQEHRRAAVDVRPVVQRLLGRHRHAVPREYAEQIEIERKGVRERRRCGGGGLQRQVLGQKQHGGHAARDDRVQDEAQDHGRVVVLRPNAHIDRPPVFRERRGAVLFGLPADLYGRKHDHLHDEPEHDEDAEHDRDVEVHQDRDRERDAVERGLLFADQLFDSHQHERSQHDRVHPHDVPAVCDDERRERIRPGEGQREHAALLSVVSQEDRESESAEPGLQHDQVGDEFNDMLPRQEAQQPVERVRQIIGEDREEVRAAADVPGPGEAAAAVQFIQEFRRKRSVLVIEVRPQEHMRAERVDALNDKGGQHDQHGDEECQQVKGSRRFRIFHQFIHGSILFPARIKVKEPANCIENA